MGWRNGKVEMIMYTIDVFLHLDKYLSMVIQNYGVLTYLILFLIIFAETGFVVTPFLPGDSLLFAAGAFAGIGALDVSLLLVLLSVAAIAGDSVNYSIGKYVGFKIYEQDTIKFIKKEHLLQTHQFYEKHGAITIIIARFIPIIRTFAPFVAGIGEMKYMKFITYNVVGGLLWIFSLVGGGYFFGNLPVVKNNFSLVIFAVVVISVLPVIIGLFRQNSTATETKS